MNLPKTRFEFVDLINEYGFKTGVELGVEYGPYSYYLLKHSNLDKLYSVDSWVKHPQRRIHAAKLLEKMGDRSTIIHDSGVNAAKQFKPNSLDFIFIDGNHFYDFVLEDIVTWYPLIRPGGIVAGHDYVISKRRGRIVNNEVAMAVTEFLKTHPAELHLTDEILSSWWFIKQE